MPVPTTFHGDFSTVAANNFPTGGETIGASLDDYLRGYQSVLKTALGHVISVKDYGALCDGVTDDTSAITSAISGAAGKTLAITGTPLISSKLTISSAMKLVFQGAASSGRPSSYFIKKSTMTTACVEITASGVIWEGGGVVAQVGNTGDNISIKANGVRLNNVYSEAAGGMGFIVDSTGGGNANSWRLDGCRANSNGSHGFQIKAENTGGGPNSNAGVATSCFAQSNAGDGFNSTTYASWNEYLGCLSETNTGYGIRFNNGRDNIWSGDVEGNTAGNMLLESRERNFVTLSKNGAFGATDSGYYTRRLDRYLENRGSFTPGFRGTGGTQKTATAVTISGTTATIAVATHGYANGDTVSHVSGLGNNNLLGAFQISNVSTNAYDITFRTDQEYSVPTSATGLTGVVQKCGACSTALGTYVRRSSSYEFWAHMIFTSVTNITGSVQFILPFTTDNINANAFAAIDISYHSGITYTGTLKSIAALNAVVVANIYDTVSGAPGTPAQLQGTGLAATAEIILYGSIPIAEDA